MKSIRLLAAIACILAAVACSPKPEKAPTEVVVISTLHFFHGKVDYYTYGDLKALIAASRPAILALEVDAKELAGQKDMPVKMEYLEAIFPYMEETGIPVVAMEPEEPLYSDLVNRRKSAEAAIETDTPEKYARNEAFSGATYDFLFTDYWTSAAAVNSDTTDDLFRAKHAVQDYLHNEDQLISWQGWNGHFLEKIREAAKLSNGGRVVVLVGVEHSYWLKDAIRKDETLKLVPVPVLEEN